MKKNILKLTFGVVLLSLGLASCTEEIDESARYTRKQETLTDYLRNNPQYSEYYSFITEVPISPYSKSTVDKLLSARGNFVVFAPTNDAISRYLDSAKVVVKEIPADARVMADIPDPVIADSLKKVIVHNSVVDFSEFKSVFQYISDIEPKGKEESKTMIYSNLNNRFLTVSKMVNNFKVLGEEGDSVLIESYPIEGAHTYKCDIELYNGIVHEMYEVVAPSNDNIVDILGATSNMRAFSHILSLCNLGDTLLKSEDEVYHELYWSNPTLFVPVPHKTQGRVTKPVEQRMIGFTAFVETDDVYEQLGLMTNGKIDLEKLRAHLEPLQPSGLSQGDDYESEDNWLNFFVTYHLLPEMIDYDYLVIHYNELGYRWDNPQSRPTITQHEHYTTMGKPRLLNISEGSDTVVNGTNGKRLNYFAKIARSNTNPFTVEQLYNQGILIRDPKGMENAPVDPVNGKIYPIDELLVYTPQIAKWQGTMRMRINVAALFPELMNNRMRRRMNDIGDIGWTKYYQFLRNMRYSDESLVYYLPGYGSGWSNYQGDEFNIMGVYDITIKMPPIPYDNTYEIRTGVSANNQRGMMQVYFGTDEYKNPAAGLPLDMRMGGKTWHVLGVSPEPDSYIGWAKDEDDETLNTEVDKLLRLQDFMKAPAGFAAAPDLGTINVGKSLRNTCVTGQSGDAVRRILLRQDLKADETYYIRFQDALGTGESQFFFDYIEIVPKEVYDNPVSPEDIW